MLPVEQPRRKRDIAPATNRRMNAMKHQHASHTHPAIFKDAFGGAKIGKIVLTVSLFELLTLCLDCFEKLLMFKVQPFSVLPVSVSVFCVDVLVQRIYVLAQRKRSVLSVEIISKFRLFINKFVGFSSLILQ